MTHYDEFDVSPNATPEEIRLAHRNLARLLHPDTFQDDHLRRLAENQMKRINRIYAILSDPVQRRNYDFQLVTGGALMREPRRLPAAVRWRAAAPWLIAAAGVAAGLYPYLDGPSRVRPIPTAIAAVPPPESDVAAAASPLAKGSAKRKTTTPPARERPTSAEDIAGSPRRRPAANPALTERTSRPPGEPFPAELPKAQARAEELFSTIPAPAVAAPDAPIPAVSPYAGTWLFVPGSRKSTEDLYPPEYIELTVSGDGDSVWGRYRARYRVTDRAISPEVNFQFESNVPVPERIAWSGNGGAKGEVRLKLLSANRLSVDWFTNSFGHQLALGSGTAVLVRRESDK